MNEEIIYISDKVVGLDDLVDYKVAAKIIGLQPRTVQNMVADKKLPFYRYSKRCNRFLVRELISWCEDRKVA